MAERKEDPIDSSIKYLEELFPQGIPEKVRDEIAKVKQGFEKVFHIHSETWGNPVIYKFRERFSQLILVLGEEILKARGEKETTGEKE